ncbi:hypothetical protein [Tissierella sp. Yu-01]|uniref:hypothetical protein n=1 Tax=Tissierella sp. Yu-01 TaxID=3035694 RepID=UPI00240CF319|nr:hypothetical protein [Tissierella sp. Yu-01]WFA10351.1 hypothetical protein P3962_07305 [Tissierella sp. Yu-01]
MYKAYRCNKCRVVFAIPTEDIRRMEKQGRYIACPFGHKEISEPDKYDSLKECMDNSVYVREGRRMRQIK